MTPDEPRACVHTELADAVARARPSGRFGRLVRRRDARGASHDTRADIVLGICVAMGFTTLLDQAIFTLAVPALRSGLRASTAEIQLITSVYSIAFGIALVPAGRLGDVIGRRLLFLVGLAMFTGFSVLGGLADDARTVIAARVLQGLGAGMINTQIFGLIQDLFTGTAQARALGRYAMAGGLSALVGPLLGGLVLASVPPDIGWRLLFLVNAPFGVAVFCVALRYLPRHRPSVRRFSIDLIGLMLLSAITLALMLATLVGSAAMPSRRVCLAVALAGLPLFLAWEAAYQRRGGTPILSRSLVGSRGYVLGTIVAMCQFAAGVTLGMVSALFFLDGLHVDPLRYAALSIPAALASTAAAMWSWRFVRRFGRGGTVLAIACHALAVAAQGCAAEFLEIRWIVLTYPAIALLQGVASGLIHAPNQAMTLAAIGQDEGRGLAAGFLQLSQRLACSIGMSWGTGVFLVQASSSAGLTAYRDAFVEVLMPILLLVAGAFLAACADGVDKDKVYPIDVPRALKKLKELRSNVLLWDSGADSLQLLRNGEVSMACIWHTRANVIQRESNGRFRYTWEQGLASCDVWGVPKNNPSGDAVWQFIKFVQGVEPQVRLLSLLGNGPVTPAATAAVPQALRADNPGTPENWAKQCKVNPEWWAQHYEATLAQYTDLMSS